MSNKVQRNQLCVCGSGRKYKQCCINKQPPVQQRWGWWLIVALFLAGAAGIVFGMLNTDDSVSSGGVWSEEHQHYH